MKFPRHLYKKGWEWRAELAAKKISAKEIAGEYLARAKADKTNSFLALMESDALLAAEAVDAGKVKHALAGLPVGIKDNLVTKGVRTTCASKILENYHPPYNATVVEKLHAAGTVPVGK